jgi:ABC-type antimicrobial peptide transport system permease subunit
VGGLGLSFLVRRARSSWLLLSCVAVTVLLATGLAAVLWTFAVTVIPPGALSILAAPQGRVIELSGVADAQEAAADSQLIAATLHKAWPGVGFQMDSALWALPVQLSSVSGQPTKCTNPSSPTPFPGCTSTLTTTQVQVASLEGFSAQATLTAGKWPGPPRYGGPVPVALPAAGASRLHLKLGSVLKGAPTSGGATISLQVTGLFRPKNPASLYWRLDLLPASGISAQSANVTSIGGTTAVTSVSYGPAAVNPAAFGGALTAGQASWTVLPRAPVMARGNVGAFATNTSQAVSQLSLALPEGLKVTSDLPGLLAGIASTIVLARSLFAIGALELLLVAGAGLVLAARLLASLREEESALLRARGATRWQVVRPVLAEAVVVGAVAGLAGVLLGTSLTGVLARLGGMSLESYSGVTPLAWLSALVVLVLCAAVMAWPALRALSPGAARRRRGRQARLAGIAWAGGDLAVVALAAVAVWQLHGYSAVAHPATGSLGIDPVVAVAPALALAGVALIPLRGLPLLARLADKATDRERRLAAAMVSWQIARRPIRQAGPVLLVVVATAASTLALAGYASWQRSAADQAAFAVGSDVQVDSSTVLSSGAAAAIAQAPGVTAATPASVLSITSASQAAARQPSLTAPPSSGASTIIGQMIALDASTAGKTILLRSDLSPLPLSTLWQRIIPRHLPGLTLPGQPGRLEILATLATLGTAGHGIAGLSPVTISAEVQEADGNTYGIPADGSLPFDGRPHSLVFTLPGPGQAIYPLRLLGLELNYPLPPFNPATPSGPDASLIIRSLAVAATASGPLGRPFADGAAVAWQGRGSSPFVPTGPPSPYGGTPPAGGAPPSFLSGNGAPGGAEQFTLSTGQAPSLQVMQDVGLAPGAAAGQITLMAQPSQIVPVIATAGYLAANHLGIGSTTPISLNGYPVTVQIVASVARFPTVLGQNQALIADLPEIDNVLTSTNAPPLPVTRVWLSTAGGRLPRLPASLGLTVTDRASQQAALLGNPLLKAPRQAMLAIGLAAVLLGMLGFSVGIAASVRSRRTLSAVFAALGVGKNAQAGLLCLEQCALSLPAAAVGLLAGIGLAELIVPAITLTTGAAVPVPSALAVVPLGPAAALAFVIAAAPAVAAALTVARRPDPAAQLRAEAI